MKRMPAISSDVPIGYLMKGAEMPPPFIPPGP
jgi:hypothetical protein